MSPPEYDHKKPSEQTPTGATRSSVISLRRYAKIYETPAWSDRRLGQVTALIVYHGLLLYADPEGYLTLRIKRLAGLLGISDRSVQYHLATLIKRGLVRRFTQHRPDGGFGANRFWVSRAGIAATPSEADLHQADAANLHPYGEGTLHHLARARREPRGTNQFEQKKDFLRKLEVLGRGAPFGGEVARRQSPPEPAATNVSDTESPAETPAPEAIGHPKAYNAAVRAAKRQNMLARLNGLVMVNLTGTAQRQAYDLLERGNAIVGDDAAWQSRSRTDKHHLTQLRQLLVAYKAQHGALPPARTIGSFHVDPGDRVDALKALADVKPKLERQFLADWAQRHPRREDPPTEKRVSEPDDAA
jgi:hypothetical protein